MATVLIVEDDTLSQKILTQTLTNAGHEALIAATIEQAWAELHRNVIVDLIILDNQLRHEWGWEFLRELRKNPVYLGLSVIVYTAYTERSSMLKYVELGVQGVLVKPYVAQTVLAEVAKAVKTGWASRLMESPQNACARLKISEADYSSFLHAAISTLGKSVKEARQLVGSKGAKIHPWIARIKIESIQLGMPIFKTLGEATDEALENRDHVAVDRCLATMEAVLGLVRQQAMNCVGLGDAVRRTPFVATQKADEPSAEPFFAPPADMNGAFCRRMAARPIWNFGRYFGRLRGGRVIDAAEIEKLAAGLIHVAPLNSFFTAAELVVRVPDLPVDETVEAIAGIPGFDAVYLRIASQLGFYAENTSIEENVRDAIRRQGTAKAISLATAGRIAIAGRISSPLDLQPLLDHTVAVSLLSFELGRLLQMDDAHLLSAAGAIHDIGKWLLAIGEPALYAVALALTQSENLPISQAETEIFGLSHENAGALVLQLGQSPALLRETALYHSFPEKVTDRRHAPFVAIVHLADHIARAVHARDETFASDVRTRLLSPTYTTWTILKANGIELPLDIPDLVDAMFSIAETSSWMTTVLLKSF